MAPAEFGVHAATCNGDVAARATAAPLSRISAEYRELEKSEPLLIENPHRWVMFPIQHP
eukprot:CAMPEP_0179253740 /NCGR_PEP_ID=MMETSP0797-20121207/22886_1 /TAXON_ID=47934 /ORGANISM="Dinophysis acuminata, Strain DAEP01" /LENGTH=58 /DNA_ID=CAMNT_0020961611 /DNA_START=46 /DNA_END=218 /DNA_ORIENTATION=-